MFCGKCGVSVENSQAFCVTCGFQLNGQVSTTLAPSIFEPQNYVHPNSSDAPKPMSFIETIKFSYKNYARFSGRASRSEYWYWQLYVWSGLFVFGFYGAFLGALAGSTTPEILGLLFYYLFLLSALVPGIARGVRRLHDTNKSGWHFFFILIPLVGHILLIVWFCTKGDSGSNRFGPQDLNKGQEPLDKVSQEQTSLPVSVVAARGNNSVDIFSKWFAKNWLLVIASTSLVFLFGVLQSHVQYGRLIGSIEISEVQMEEYNEKSFKSFEENTSGTPAQFDSNESKIAYETEERYLSGLYESRIRNAGKSVTGISLLPWNGQHRIVKSNYLAHNVAWQKELAQSKTDPLSSIFLEEISSTWLKFCQELKSEIPWYTFGRFDSRIAIVCISDSDQNSTN